MPVLKIILAFVAASFLLNSIIKFAKKEKSQTLFKLGASIVIWGGISMFALFPEITHQLSESLGMGENLNTLIFLGFVVIFMIVYKFIHTIEKIEKNISEIVRKEALRDLDKKIK
jgi:hypothetical protein